MEEARDKAGTELLVFLEDHIIIMHDFMPALLRVTRTSPYSTIKHMQAVDCHSPSHQ
jgi:hypothetical protein